MQLFLLDFWLLKNDLKEDMGMLMANLIKNDLSEDTVVK
jgi:hypothetical protein